MRLFEDLASRSLQRSLRSCLVVVLALNMTLFGCSSSPTSNNDLAQVQDLLPAPDLQISVDLVPGPDLKCTTGAACVPTNPCHVGAMVCDMEFPVCQDTLRVVSDDPKCTLLAYWPLDGNGTDVAGGRDLVLEGGIGFADGVLGKGLDLHHNKVQYAHRPASDDVFNLLNTDFTIQAWLYFYALAGEQTFVEKYTNSLPPTFTLTKLDSNQFRFHGPVVLDAPVTNFPLTTWLHVVMRKDSANFMIFYNGVQVAISPAQPMQSSSVPLLIGKRIDVDGRDFSFNGRIDEVAFWKRALSQDEIKALYNGGKGSPASNIN